MSVQTEKEAIQLVKESRELCHTGKLRLHKFVSNSENVLSTIPEEECTTVKDQDMALSLPHMERALGVEWCISSDSFKFRVDIKPKKGCAFYGSFCLRSLGIHRTFCPLGETSSPVDVQREDKLG